MTGPWEQFQEGPWSKFASPPPAQKVSEPSSEFGSLKRGVGNVASVLDLGLGIPGQALTVGADMGGRLSALIHGGSRSDAEWAGKYMQGKVPEALLRPLGKIMQVLGFGQEYTGTDVEAVMGKIQGWIDQGGEEIEKLSRGALTKGDIQSLANTAMFAVGARATGAALDPKLEALSKVKAPKEQETSVLERMEKEATPLAKPPEPPILREQIDQYLGVNKKPLSKSARAKRAKELQEAFDENSPWADQLRAYSEGQAAEYAARDLEASRHPPTMTRTRPPERAEFQDRPVLLDPNSMGLTEKGADSLTRAKQKVARLGLWSLTAEEKIAWDKFGKEKAGLLDQYGKPLALGGVGLAIYSAMDDREKGFLAALPFALAMRRAEPHIPAALHRGFERAKLGDEGSLHHLDMLRMELPPEQRALLDPAIHALEEVHFKHEGVTITAPIAPIPQDKKDPLFGVIPLAIMLKMPEGTPMGALHKGLRYTTGALAALARELPNRFELTKEQIEGVLGRQGVTQVEKDLIRGVVGERETISAKDLVTGVRAATGDFELTPSQTTHFADYGLEKLNRNARNFHQPGTSPVDATTTKYKSPLNLGTANHFSDPNYFAHARSFDEGGVRHVVEIQSDVAQKAGKQLTPDERIALGEEATRVRIELRKTRRLRDGYILDDSKRAELSAKVRELSVRAAELDAKVSSDLNVESVRPILKDWWKRIIREEVAQGGQGGIIRFATADTVAKVEGWPTVDWANEVRLYKESVRRLSGNPMLDDHPVALKEKANLAHAEEMLAKLGPGERIEKSEHQSIYDRYRREIEKFLKSEYKARPYTDAHGHTWLEVDLPGTEKPISMFGQGGKAKTDLLVRMAAFGLGAAATHALSQDPSLLKDFLGGFGGAMVAGMPVGRLAKSAAKLLEKDPRASVGKHLVSRENNLMRWGIDTYAAAREITKLVPREERLNAISHAIQSGDLSSLSPVERRAARLASAYYDVMGAAALKAGVLKESKILHNYVTQIWDLKPEQADAFAKWFERHNQSMSPSSPFAKTRKIPTIADGKAAGFTPKSENIAYLMTAYGRSIALAIENQKLLDSLKKAKHFDGTPLVLPSAKAPEGWARIQHPQLNGLAVHPDIEMQVRFAFDNPPTKGFWVAMKKLSDFAKHNAVSASLFHAKALTDALIGAGSMRKGYVGGALAGAALGAMVDPDHPLRGAAMGGTLGYVGGRLKDYLSGKSFYLQELKKGTASELVDDAAKSGLKFSAGREELAVEDAGQTFYSALEHAQKTADRLFYDTAKIPAGKAIGAYIAANKKLDSIMWGRLHTGMKLQVWAEKRAQLLENSAREGKPLSVEEAGKMSASFTNDMFGGLNWVQIAMESESRIGRMVGEYLLNPKSRFAMQIALFAPDWTISTTRAALKAIDKDLFIHPGKAAKGLFRPTTVADLHRQYIARSAIYYLTVADAINYSMSGHHIWDNKDWTFIDWGDGRRMQWSKHTMEPIHWAQHPVKQAINKLGFVPREIANQAFGTEYLSPHVNALGDISAGPRMEGSRLGHLAKSMSPISLQQGLMGQGDSWSALAGFAGTPIYGMTEAQKAEAREKKRRERMMAK